MKFIQTHLAGAYLIELEKIVDQRGFFARTWCQNEFADKQLNSNFVQCNVSYNKMRGTLRGMHYQKAPHGEAKLVRVTQGAVYDVIVDLRSDSKTIAQWFGVELTAENRRALFVPEGFAHGFITLKDNSEVLYQMSEFFYSSYSAGVRWNDPAFGIKWPISAKVISERDCKYSDFKL
ncbi:dTDP-4-dehydrorhamnose 3,5-epimerase [Pseudomonadales bacterium]|nr:dTDP-4-dehydrorhamnose 3,5-epimerase [Pseudomonadales bacterium]